jgi:ATP-dependent Clp protease ATP-binding subunit ClpB/ATP-dependent Clp protease ATP-binding subunit ClpC
VIFITRIENGKSSNEGICLKCARELNIKPVEDIIRRMGLTDEDLESLTDEMMDVMGGYDSLAEHQEDEDNIDDGKTATFPFLSRLFGGPDDSPQRDLPRSGRDIKDKEQGGNAQGGANTTSAPGNKRRKYLESYCISLTQRAAESKLDRIVGRETETERVVQILNRRQKNNP